MKSRLKKTPLKTGQIVWSKDLKDKGRLAAWNRLNPELALIEVITSQNKETGERTTKLVEVPVVGLSKYKKPVPKKKAAVSEKRYNPNEAMFMVRDMHKAFNHPVATIPAPMSLERAVDRKVWGAEEQIEFLHASSSNVEEFKKAVHTYLEGLQEAFQKSLEKPFPGNDFDRLVAQVDALTDESYFVNGDFVEIGIVPSIPFNIVHNANMGKLHIDEDGNTYAKYREEDGKIQKPENWEKDFAPESKLLEEVLRQLKNATKKFGGQL